MEDVVLYGPVAGSTAYCQVANTNVLGPLATTVADTNLEQGRSAQVIQNSWEDGVWTCRQMAQTGPPVDQRIVPKS